jgi:hypothetical protein
MSIQEQIRGDLRRGRPPDEVVAALVKKGLSEPTARRFVDRARGASADSAAQSAEPSPSTVLPGERFTVGSVLADSLRTWAANLIPFLVLTVICHSPLVLYTVALVSEGQFGPLLGFNLVNLAGRLILGAITAGALAYGVVQYAYGERARVGRCIAVGVGQMLPTIGVALVVGLRMLAAPIILYGVVLALPFEARQSIAGFPFYAGLVLCAAVAAVVACRLWVAVPVSVMEQPGVGASIRRSTSLTHGHRWRIFVILALLELLGWGAEEAIEAAYIRPDATLADVQTYFYLVLAATLVVGTLRSTAQAVSYARLMIEKDAAAGERLAHVFE